MAAERDGDHGRGTSSTLLNGVLGAIVGVVLFFLPFSTVLGGAAAGYLEGGEPRNGAVVGVVAGVVTTLPLLLVLWVVVAVVGLFEPLALPVTVLATLLGAFILLYIVGLSVIGGVLGVVVREEIAR